ncbi:hypothetical protein F2Q69_00033080 [Brassica cretica]|uniref:Uncharacterized protein n=1 Tax=Brassica cretica TaxID=69181 RepID=A0A8S9SMM6_BRACR|nr:hypothetical protein F2Q69_00033080 [Brassica cretica]
MDSDAGPRQPQSGGKIVRPRRRFAVRTPYDRPAPRSRDPPQQNPSWISRLVYKPVTVIASGAGKFISSVVFSESSSSSSEDEDSSSGDDEDVLEDETMVEESTIQRLGSKRVIEQLLMQETFAREEGDRLIDIIKARVVDHPSVPTPNEGRHSDNEVDVGEMSNKAVMEAKRWLEEKKSASSSKSIATEDGGGSPVDVAKTSSRVKDKTSLFIRWESSSAPPVKEEDSGYDDEMDPVEEAKYLQQGFDVDCCYHPFGGIMPCGCNDSDTLLAKLGLHCYNIDKVKDSELQDNEWLNLYAEIALSSERPDMETYLPLKVKKVVVRTKEDVEPSNAIFYMTFKTHRGHECKAIIRQTRDGIQGHMCLEVTCMLGK